MLLRELIETAAARVDLFLRRREFAHLQREFPPRPSAFWPALLLLSLGLLLFLAHRP
jgi:hypothetical protein